ncbi:uncharacterized protein K489DRAFT_371046 [Dissoconium aciculare CBS 342.82]|uniref:Uncharacterized protein n=1 Tax=Dissoconium aciculare CBS 342.82 TaxID=1314786 RepID=A0A6J3M2E1_9PEZI|nr:uncharacterized protein K489DRAFT_371046 [Dissoconium aciculare CBS 342.82]KAF1822185.1 hypothetical protein K489DRAFT_371046 [Dissoconium aciculare CBS 342.82]
MCNTIAFSDLLLGDFGNVEIVELSSSKSDFLSRIGLKKHCHQDRLLFRAMMDEARAGRDRLFSSRACLVPTVASDLSIQTPYLPEHISEVAFSDELRAIFTRASSRTQGIYNTIRSPFPDLDFWIIRWTLARAIEDKSDVEDESTSIKRIDLRASGEDTADLLSCLPISFTSLPSHHPPSIPVTPAPEQSVQSSPVAKLSLSTLVQHDEMPWEAALTQPTPSGLHGTRSVPGCKTLTSGRSSCRDPADKNGRIEIVPRARRPKHDRYSARQYSKFQASGRTVSSNDLITGTSPILELAGRRLPQKNRVGKRCPTHTTHLPSSGQPRFEGQIASSRSEYWRHVLNV